MTVAIDSLDQLQAYERLAILCKGQRQHACPIANSITCREACSYSAGQACIQCNFALSLDGSMLSSRSRNDPRHCKITSCSNSTALQQSRMLHTSCSIAESTVSANTMQNRATQHRQSSKLTSKPECVGSKDEGGKVCQTPNSRADSDGDVASCVLIWQILPTKVLAYVCAEEEQQVGEERCLDSAPAQSRTILS